MLRTNPQKSYDKLKSAIVKRYTVEDSHGQALLSLEKFKLTANADRGNYYDKSMRPMVKAESANDVARVGQLKKNVKWRAMFVHFGVMKSDTPQDFFRETSSQTTLETARVMKQPGIFQNVNFSSVTKTPQSGAGRISEYPTRTQVQGAVG